MSFRKSPIHVSRRLLATTALTSAIFAGAGADAAQVRLTTSTGSAAIEGELLSYQNGIYTVETVIGQINVADEGVICEGAGCDIEVAAAIDAAAVAETAYEIGAPNGIPGERITLTSENGAIRIEGSLVAFENETYTIETVIGTFEVDAATNTCEGPGCPTGDVLRAAVSTRLPTIAGDPDPTVAAPPAEEPAVVAALPAPEPQPAPAPEPAPPPPQILLANVAAETPAVTIAGPASVLDGLLPALAELYARGIGGTSKLADVTTVDHDVAVAAGFPAGKLAALVESSDQFTLAVVGQLTSTAATAIGSLNDASADIALSATAAPMMLVQNRTEAVLGNEALVAVVAPENGVFQLAPAQLAAVFAGEVDNWQDVGGADRPIRIFGLPDSHDLTVARDEMVLSPFNLAARTPDQVFASEAELIAALASDPAAIGMVSHSATQGAKPLAIGSPCGITVTATPENIRTARYPFSRSLVALSFAADGPAAKIIDAIETAGDPLILAAGLEPVTLARFPMSDDEASLRVKLPTIDDRSQRLNAANALRVMPTSERLGTVLTFDGRSNRLDTRSKAELARIIDFIKAERLGEVVVAGHVGDSGDAKLDKVTARGLAAGVRRALEEEDAGGVLDTVVVRALGVGSVLPLKCQDAGAGDTLNRRVEVWVRR